MFQLVTRPGRLTVIGLWRPATAAWKPVTAVTTTHGEAGQLGRTDAATPAGPTPTPNSRRPAADAPLSDTSPSRRPTTTASLRRTTITSTPASSSPTQPGSVPPTRRHADDRPAAGRPADGGLGRLSGAADSVVADPVIDPPTLGLVRPADSLAVA